MFLRCKDKIDEAYDCYYYEGPYIRLNDYVTNMPVEKNVRTNVLHKLRKQIANTFTNNPDGTAGHTIYESIKKII